MCTSTTVTTVDVAKRTALICSEYAGEAALHETQIHSSTCTFSYAEIDEPNDIQIAPMIVTEVDYDDNANDVDASSFITAVHFVSSRLSSLPSLIFQKFTNMKTLNCDGVNLQSLSSADMKGAANLTEFSCNSNYVKTLGKNAFENSKQLESLDISINDIESIDSTAFGGLSELKKLLLYDNKLNSLPEDIFKDLSRLNEINLSNNQLQTIDVKLFSSCTALKYIYINDNLIGSIHESAFENNEHIEFLEISDNRLTSLKLNLSASGLYANNNQLQSIHLGSIGYLSFYNNSISNVIFTIHQDILSLNMSTNNLNCDSLSDIIKCSALKSLDLSFNNLGRLNVSTFLELNELQMLNLQSTNLSRIDFGLFQHQIKLEQMDISYNQLGTYGAFDLNKFISLKSLGTLFIEGNNISEFQYENISIVFPRLHTFGYSDNPWKCSYLILMNSFMKRQAIEIYHLVTVKTRSNVDGIACHDDGDGGGSSADDSKVNSGLNYEDKLHSTNSIRHKLNASDNELSVITKRFEDILMNISNGRNINHNRTDDYVSKSELINELSMIKSSIVSLQGSSSSISMRLDKLSTHDGVDESIKAIRNSSYDMKMMRKRLDDLERALEEVVSRSDNKMKQQMAQKQFPYEMSPATSASERNDFIVKAMISTIFVIVCGFVAIYIIKLYARRYHHHIHRDLRTYADGDTIDENIIL